MRFLLALGLVLAGPVSAGEVVVFFEDCTSATVILPSSTSIVIGTSWSAKENVVGAPAVTLRSEPAQCGPSGSASNVGLGYPANPAPTANVYWAEFTWLDAGTVTGEETTGMTINWISSVDFYACTISDDEALNTVFRIVKVRAGVGELAGSIAGANPNGDRLRCKIDYTNSPPILTFTNETDSVTYVSFTDSTNPLTKTPRAGVVAGANQLNTVNDIQGVLDFNDFKITEVRLTRTSVTIN